MSQDDAQGRAEALVRNCTIRTHDGMTTVPGERLLIDTITAALRAERIKALEEAATIADNFPWTLSAGSDNIPMVDMEALVKAIREQARRAGEDNHV